MEKTKLIEARKSRGYSQSQVAEYLFMDVSNYNRRENGLSRIHIKEWEKLAQVLETPMENIYEDDERQVFICKDTSTVNYQGTNHIYSVPEFLLETQQKYIKKLEEEIAELKKRLE
jgi:transcriptional regulator with XRE-family HTH domain